MFNFARHLMIVRHRHPSLLHIIFRFHFSRAQRYCIDNLHPMDCYDTEPTANRNEARRQWQWQEEAVGPTAPNNDYSTPCQHIWTVLIDE